MIHSLLKSLSRNRKRWDKANRRNANRRKRTLGLRAEKLESRLVMAVAITLDYTYDTENFFDDADAKAAMEDVAAIVSNHLNDTLDPIIPSGANTWKQIFEHPGTGGMQEVVDPSVAADEYVIYAGGRDLPNLGSGGFGGYSSFGSAAWNTTVAQRGETGVATNTDFARWGGSITFDSVGTSWHFDESTAGLTAGENDFRTVAYHELLHALGFGTANSWIAMISGGEFAGTNAVAAYDGVGNIPLDVDSGFAHFADGTSDGGQETAMDPLLTVG